MQVACICSLKFWISAHALYLSMKKAWPCLCNVSTRAGDLFDGSLLLQDTGAEMWEVDKPSGKLMVVWGTDVDMFDPQTQVTAARGTFEDALTAKSSRPWRRRCSLITYSTCSPVCFET
jgi:hypothetical protein